MKRTGCLLEFIRKMFSMLIVVAFFVRGIVPAQELQTDTKNDEQTKSKTPSDANKSVETVEEEKYFELLTLFADTLDQVERNYVEPISRRELMEAAIDGVLKKLDTYSDYIAPDELDDFKTGVENEFGGIGIRVGMTDGWLTVITPLMETPAYKAGVLAEDRIIEISGESTEGVSMSDAISKMKGPIGTDVEITVRHKHDGSEEKLTLKRDQVQVETVVGYRRNEDDSWSFLAPSNPKVGYVRITSFSRKTESDLRRALTQLQSSGVKSLILDLRFNPGGLLSSAVGVADLFLSEGEIVSTAGRNVKPRRWSATKRGTFDEFKMVVLINGFSASASEIVSASLQDHNRAVVIGHRTWGKGSVQNIIELEGGRSALKLTTAGYKRPNGKNIHRFKGAKDEDDWGVMPNEGFKIDFTPLESQNLFRFQQEVDIIASKSKVVPKEFDDRQLKKAIDYLTTEVASK